MMFTCKCGLDYIGKKQLDACLVCRKGTKKLTKEEKLELNRKKKLKYLEGLFK